MHGLPLQNERWQRAALIGLLAVALAVFCLRTVMQPFYKPCDFAAYYTASRAWLSGDNPYERSAALQHWTAAGGRPDIMLDYVAEEMHETWMPIIQAPPGMALLAPVAMIPAPLATGLWYALCAAILLLQTAALASLAGTSLWRPGGLFILAVTLLLAPTHEAFGYLQPSIPAIGMIVLAFWAASARRDILCGALLAAAMTIKPQLVGFFVLYYLFTGRWRIIVTGTIVVLAFTAISVLPMQLRGVPWLASWQENLWFAEAAPGSVNSTAPENPGRFYLLHLQVMLNGIFAGRVAVNLLALLITAALAAAFVWRRARAVQHDELLSLSIVCILTLLPVYNRFYHAAIVVVPLAWAVANLRRQPQFAWAVMLFVGSFMIPSAAAGRFARLLGHDPAHLWAFWWNALVEPWRPWVLLGGTVVLIAAIRPIHATGLATAALEWPRGLRQVIVRRIGQAVPLRSLLIVCGWIAALALAVLLDGCT